MRKGCLCLKCSTILKKFHIRNQIRLAKTKERLDLIKRSSIEISEHAEARGIERGINELSAIMSIKNNNASLIEVQNGMYRNEKKLIFISRVGKKVVHSIILEVKNRSGETNYTLINVYNPFEGMTFKWSESGTKRMYLNEFRKCCKHPEDSKENYVKRHHGLRHKLYSYQF